MHLRGYIASLLYLGTYFMTIYLLCDDFIFSMEVSQHRPLPFCLNLLAVL